MRLAGLRIFDSFLGKVQLWNNGHEVSVNVNASAGKALLTCKLGWVQKPFLTNKNSHTMLEHPVFVVDFDKLLPERMQSKLG